MSLIPRGEAELSPCLQYRYLLRRPALQAHPVATAAVFCMLNPSTADASIDDPTIRRCRGYARDWDCNGLTVVNLYALRSTDPKALQSHADPVGATNDYWLHLVAKETGDVVCAWGANAAPARAAAAIALFRAAGARLWCLGTTKSGAPRHPLYVRANQQLIEYTP